MNSAPSPLLNQRQNVGAHLGGDAVGVEKTKNGDSRERVSNFSLEIHAIGPLDFDGVRRENVLRGAGYAWTPGLRVFDNSKR